MKNEQEIKDALIAKASEDVEFRAQLLENPHTSKLSEAEMAAIAGGSHCNADAAEESLTESTKWKP